MNNARWPFVPRVFFYFTDNCLLMCKQVICSFNVGSISVAPGFIDSRFPALCYSSKTPTTNMAAPAQESAQGVNKAVSLDLHSLLGSLTVYLRYV